MQKMQHLTDKELIIMKYFYDRRFGHVRQIKRDTGLPEHTLLKYLKRLEIRGLLSWKAQGNLKVYEVNYSNNLAKVFFSLFDILKLNELEYKRRMAIGEFLLGIKQIKLPYFVLLFGSTAKGTYTKSSDVDLIVVYEIYSKVIKERLDRLVKDIFGERGLRINFVLITLGEINREINNKKNYALQDALHTGYPVFGNLLYYEVTLA